MGTRICRGNTPQTRVHVRTRQQHAQAQKGLVKKGVEVGYLLLVITVTFLGKFSCQFEQCLGLVEITAG